MIKKIYYFSGTHWDREWHQTQQSFRFDLVNAVDTLLDLLENDEKFKIFHFDGQTIVLEDYLEIRPENELRLKKLISEGRIVIGPWYCMPDEFIVSGEALVRNLLLGHQLSEKFKTTAWKVGYICDIFGHIAQMPQILCGFNIHASVLGRGTNEFDTPAFFQWEGLDKSNCLTYKVPDKNGYGAFSFEVIGRERCGISLPADSEEFAEKAKEYIDREEQRTKAPIVIIMDALDHEPPHRLTSAYIDEIKKLYPNSEVLHEDLLNAFKDVKKHENLLPIKNGELNVTAKDEGGFISLITNTLSSRYPIKKRNDYCQNLLECKLEPLYLINHYNDISLPKSYLATAWKWLLQNHPHDSICGCSVDKVHSEMEYRFAQVENIGEKIVEFSLRQFTDGKSKIIFDGDYINIVNTLPFERDDVIEINLPFSKDFVAYGEPFFYEMIKSFRLYDVNGKEVEYAITNIKTNTFIKEIAEIPIACDIYTVALKIRLNACGVTSLKIVKSEKPVRFLNSMICENTIDNGKIKVSVNDDGNINVYDYSIKKEYKNLLSFLDDGDIGDGWHSVRPHINKTATKLCVKRIDILTDNSNMARISVNAVLNVPNKMNYSFNGIQRNEDISELEIHFIISVFKNSNILNVKLMVNNTVMDHRLRLVIHSGLDSNTYYASQAYAFVERECGIDYSTADWKECAKLEKAMDNIVLKKDNENCGFAFISKGGLKECGADNAGNMYITLLRATSKTFGTDGESGGQLNGVLQYEFNLISFDNKTTLSQISNNQKALGTGVECFISDKKMDVSYLATIGKVIVSAIKPSEKNKDEFILRVYNPSGNNEEFKAEFKVTPKKVFVSNMLEELGTEMTIKENLVMDILEPFKIKTYRIEL